MRFVILVALFGTLAAIPGGGIAVAGGTGARGSAATPFDNPSANITPPAALYGGSSPCTPFGGDRWAKCNAIILGAMNEAQAKEHRRPFTLPSNFLTLTPGEQLLVWVNLERISRGVPPLVGLSSALDSAAAAGEARGFKFAARYGPVAVAVNQQTHRFAWSAFEGGGSSTPMAGGFVFDLMYDDGWAGGGKGPLANVVNPACTSRHSRNCWEDRDALLGSLTGTACRDCIAGAVEGKTRYGTGFALLLVQPAHYPAPLRFTWNGNVLPHLPAGYERVRA